MSDIPRLTCTVCRKEGWPDCGHLEGSPSPRPEDEVDAESLSDFEQGEGLTYRRRGRPKLPPDMKRREKIVVAVTGDELRDAIVAAATADGGPFRLQDWVRDLIISASKKEKP